jgi:alkanesulfonate monooxygenase SsuD/methylene tetrahydromethanopterin reductase-like flavin-dependent oxidoreductase (luciferase family)
MGSSEVKFGVDIRFNEYQLFVRCALAVEKLGFDSIWAAEAHSLDVLTKLTVTAVVTKRVKVGTSVLVPALRYPSVLAKSTSSLDHVSEGRLILGVGCSDQPSIEKRGIPSDKPVSRMVESIKILKKLWTEPTVNYDGQFYKLKNYSLPLKPVQKPHPPIWIAAYGPRMLKIAATLGDGWIGMVGFEKYKKQLNEIRRIAKESGRKPEDITPAILKFTSIAKDRETALNYATMVENYVTKISGNPDDHIQEIEKLVKSGARYFILAIVAPNETAFLESVKLYANKVIPNFAAF